MIEVTHHTVSVPSLPKSLRGLRITQLTDLHRSGLTSDRLLRRSITLANDGKPDVIVLTGDFVSNQVSDIAPVVHMLSALNAPMGIYAVMGNHDHFTDAHAVSHALKNIGVRVLRNESVLLSNGLRIVGLDDDRYRHTDIPRAFEQVSCDEIVVVLAHNPALVENLADRNCIVLSGHTHGGQIHLPVLTRRELRRIGAKHYRAGWYRVGCSRLYVSRGLGNVGLPIRFLCRPEVSEFTLAPEEKD